MARSAGQLGFEGFDDPPRATDSLFLAIRPDAASAEHIERLSQRLRSAHGLKGKSLGVERFHLTLHPLGDYVGVPPDVVAAAGAAAACVAIPAFEVVLDRVLSFRRPNNRPLVMGGGERLAGIVALHDALAVALKKTPLGPLVKPGYTPHLTLLYDDVGVDEEPVDAIRWVACEFVLLRSLLGQGRHVELARWPLSGSSA